MQRKYLWQVLSLAVCFAMLFTSISTLAFYEPGDITLDLGDIVLEAGENEYQFYLPFDASGMSFNLSGTSGEVTLATGQQTVTLSDGTAAFAQVERKGERIWSFFCDTAVTLTDVVINQKEITGLGEEVGEDEATKLTKRKYYTNTTDYNPGDYVYSNVCDLTDNEYAISTALIVNIDASCILYGGARRYIDNNDAGEKPRVIDGSIYLPGRTLALALGCYYESIPAKNYVLVRDDSQNREFYFTSQGCYEQTELGAKRSIDFHPVYTDGEVYLPLRCFAELLGKTVGYKDGIAAVDDKYAVDKIIDTSVFEYVESLFQEFEASPQEGTTYHVAQTSAASDDNSGSLQKPFLTLAKAGQVAEAGDTVIIHEGVYREILEPQNDGTAVSPIVFKAADGEKVVISAAREITGFEDYGNGMVWADVSEYDLGDGRNQIFYNGECITEARYPNTPVVEASADGEPLSDLWPVKGDIKYEYTSAKTDPQYAVSDTLLRETEEDYWKGATFLTIHGNAYVLGSAKVTASQQGKLTLGTLSTKMWHTASGNNVWNWGYLTGHKNAIDLAGEWVVEDGKLIMLPPEGETVSSLKVEMKAEQITMDLSERKFVQVIGIESMGGSAKLNNSEMCILNDVDMKYISHYAWSDDQREGYIDDFDTRTNDDSAPKRGEVGVYVGGRDNAIINSRFDHSAASALYLTGLYTYIDNNIISNCGYMGSYVSGITAYSDPTTGFTDPRGGFAIYNNTVYNSGRYLFIIQGNEGIWQEANTGNAAVPFLPFEVAYNDFHDGILYTLDAGPVYAYWINASTDRQRSRIHSNYIYSTADETNPYSFGLYFDGGSQGLDGYNNVIFTTKEGTSFTHGYTYRNPTLSTGTRASNAELAKPVIDGPDTLTADMFPKGKPFYAGALQGSDPYLVNYERQDESAYYIAAASANAIGNVTISSDGAVFEDTEAVLCFPEVDLSGGKNQLHLYFGGDRYNGGGIVRLAVCESSESYDTAADRHELSLKTDADALYETDYVTTDIAEHSGKCDVYVLMPNKVFDTKIYGIMVTDDAIPGSGHDGSSISAVDFDSVYARGTSTSVGVGDGYVNNTHPGTVLFYKDVTLSEVAKYFYVVMGIGSSYADQTVNIRMNSPTATPVATYRVTASSWNDRSIKAAALSGNQELPAGTYDIYVEFTGGSTSNFFSFGFSADNPLT